MKKSRSNVVSVVGLQWGDEGKGKITDLLGQQAQFVVRAQGGNNAGHTIVVGNQEYKFHLIPSGILSPDVICCLGAGVVIDPSILLKEIDQLEAQGIKVAGRLWISPYAHIILPYHQYQDALEENSRNARAIGTTGRGIGPCYVDRCKRSGIRVAEWMDPTIFASRFRHEMEEKNRLFTQLYEAAPLSIEPSLCDYSQMAQRCAPFVRPVEELLARAHRQGAAILLEGAQGALLDVSFGTYPYVTSSSTISTGLLLGSGLANLPHVHVLGIAKAYATRVGKGPFPTQLSEKELSMFPDHQSAREVGSTTGRLRSMGWLDLFALKFTATINGVDSLAIAKLDILDDIDEIKVCIGYRCDGKIVDYFPPLLSAHPERFEAVYHTLPGWKQSTKKAISLAALPQAAQEYLHYIEQFLNIPISIVSLGPKRDQTIVVKKFFG